MRSKRTWPAAGWAGVALGLAVCAAGGGAADEGPRAVAQHVSPVQRNEAFLAHVRRLGPDKALQAAAIADAWRAEYRDTAPESFIPDALAQLYDDFAAALAAFDEGSLEEAAVAFGGLTGRADPYLAATAAYFQARSLAGLERYEEIAQLFDEWSFTPETIDPYTPYAAQFWYLRSAADARRLEFEQALESLRPLARSGPDGPESVRNAAQQLRLELERLERGSLSEVAEYMEYVTDRLQVPDTSPRVRDRQEQILALLDKLIEEQEQAEQQGGGGGGGSRRAAGEPMPTPGAQGQGAATPAEESTERSGQGKIGDLHGAPRVEPGEMWGKLPPDERERILQAIRERYPSRYRQLVEQYYRSLAEEK